MPATAPAGGGRPPSLRALIPLAFVALAAAVTVGVLLAGAPAPTDRGTARTASPTRPPVDLGLPPVTPGETWVAGTYDRDRVQSPTAQKAQSKAWFADGRWWAVIHGIDSRLRIHVLDELEHRFVDTGVVVDAREDAHVDVLWKDDRLYVAAAGPRATPDDRGMVSRYRLTDGRFVLEPDFPVPVTARGTSSIVLDRDGAGRTWVAFLDGDRLALNASEGNDLHWGAPFTPSIDGVITGPEDLASLIAFDPGRVGVMWSNQRTDAVYFSTHVDGEARDAWSPTETAVQGLLQADDHINLKSTSDGRVIAATKTSQDNLPNANPLAPQIVLLVRETDGAWHSVVVAQVRDGHTRPIVLLDEEHRVLYVAATAPFRGGAIHMKRSSLDRLGFETGLGTPVLADPAERRISNVSSTKQTLTSESDLVLLASDNTTGHYVYTRLELGPPAAEPMPIPPVTDVTIANEGFDGWEVGERAPLWAARPAAADVVVGGTGESRYLSVRSTRAGEFVRGCREFAETSGALTMSMVVRSTAVPGAVPEVLLRGRGGDAAAVRFDDSGRWVYKRGAERLATAATWAAGTWYRLVVTVDTETDRYRWSIARVGEAEPIVSVADAATIAPIESVDEVCAGSSSGAAAVGLDIDRLAISVPAAEAVGRP